MLRNFRNADDSPIFWRMGFCAGRFAHTFLAEIGYRKEVPMGGNLPKASAGAKAPTFLVAASKDPIGANLDRIQMIKGWLDKDGKTHEKIYDVVWGNADRRKRGGNGKIPPVGDTVDVSRATWTNTIGDPELMTV
jgi:hypothetical protein